MKRLFDADSFTGFGPSRFRPNGEPTNLHHTRGRTPTLHKAVQGDVPKLPGVYGMLDRHGALIYVGKAKSLRCRLMSYFRPNSREPKAGRIIEETRTLLWEPNTSEFAALLRELELIRRFLPRFNSQGKPGRARYVYVCIGRGPAPYAYVAKKPTGKEVARFGPLTGRAQADEAVRRINDHFELRDCSQSQKMRFSDQRELFPLERTPGCLRVEIGTCKGPCVGGCSSKDYDRGVARAKAFLDGRSLTPLSELEQEMARCASACQFERAAALRDKLLALQWLNERLSWLRNARDRHSFVYPLVGEDGVTRWYLIHRGQVTAVARQPRGPRQKEAMANKLAEVFRDRDAQIGVAEVDSVLLVASWFRRHSEEHARVLTRRRAEAIVGPAGG